MVETQSTVCFYTCILIVACLLAGACSSSHCECKASREGGSRQDRRGRGVSHEEDSAAAAAARGCSGLRCAPPAVCLVYAALLVSLMYRIYGSQGEMHGTPQPRPILAAGTFMLHSCSTPIIIYASYMLPALGASRTTIADHNGALT